MTFRSGIAWKEKQKQVRLALREHGRELSIDRHVAAEWSRPCHDCGVVEHQPIPHVIAPRSGVLVGQALGRASQGVARAKRSGRNQKQAERDSPDDCYPAGWSQLKVRHGQPYHVDHRQADDDGPHELHEPSGCCAAARQKCYVSGDGDQKAKRRIKRRIKVASTARVHRISPKHPATTGCSK